MQYMIVPRKVDLFLNPAKKGRLASKDVERIVRTIVTGKLETEWKGLRLSAIGRPIVAKPPQKIIVRGTIEEILGTVLS